jgi:ABC-type glycerol-3-phosphate transport system permease component
LGGVFALLYLRSPRRPGPALAYLRYTALVLAAALTLSPFAWLICAAFKDADVLMKYTFLPPPTAWFARKGIDARDVSDWAGLCETLAAAGREVEPGPARRVWECLPESARAAALDVRQRAGHARDAFAARRAGLDAARGADPSPEALASYQDGFSRLQEELRTRLERAISPVQKQALLDGLRAILARRDFHTTDAFETLAANEGLARALQRGAESPGAADVARLNRLLLEMTFPDQIRASRAMNLDNFTTLFAGEETVQGRVYFWQYLLNSLFLAGAATTLQLFLCSMAGYALAKYRFAGRNLIVLYMLGTMMVPAVMLLAPVYKLIHSIGWSDSYLALLVPGAVTAFGIVLFRQAILSVPDELIEAGRIDGCGEFHIYLHLVMPLVRPLTSAFCLVAFLGSWNNFLGPQIFIHTQGKLTVPVVLNQYMGVYTQQYGVFLAGTLLAIIPPAILFFALQREFVSGLTSGAVKG